MTSEQITYPFTRDDILQPAGQFTQLRDEQPVAKVTLPTGDEAWLVTRYDDVRQVLGDARFDRGFAAPEDLAGGFGGFLSYLAVFARPGAQARFRRVGGKALLDCADQLRDTIQAIVDDALADLAAAGPPADLVSTVHLPVPIRVICELIGVPQQHQHTFRGWANTFLSIDGFDHERISAAQRDMDGYVRELLASRRGEPGTDYLSTLLTTADVDGAMMTEDEVVATTYALLVSGYETVAHALGKGMLALFRAPDQLDAVRADPSRVSSAVEEFLRYAPPDAGFGMPLHATENAEIGGVPIAAGEPVLVGVWSANRDDRCFPDPDRFDVTRRPNPHLSFGIGVRYCTGAALARGQMEAVLAGLLTRFPGLALAIPVDEVEATQGFIVEGPRELPVTW